LATARAAAAAPTTQTSSPSDILHKDTDDVWLAASSKAAQGKLGAGKLVAAQPFVLAQKRQKRITAEVENQQLKVLAAGSGPVHATILRELGHWRSAPRAAHSACRPPAGRGVSAGCAQAAGMLPDSSLLSDSCLACHVRAQPRIAIARLREQTKHRGKKGGRRAKAKAEVLCIRLVDDEDFALG
jgi:hypothetical protein